MLEAIHPFGEGSKGALLISDLCDGINGAPELTTIVLVRLDKGDPEGLEMELISGPEGPQDPSGLL